MTTAPAKPATPAEVDASLTRLRAEYHAYLSDRLTGYDPVSYRPLVDELLDLRNELADARTGAAPSPPLAHEGMGPTDGS